MGESILSLARHGDVVSSFSGQSVEIIYLIFFRLRLDKILITVIKWAQTRPTEFLSDL